MIPLCQLEWDDGILRSFGEGLPTQTWTRPADLAAARLAILPAPEHIHVENGIELLTAVFKVIPFLRGLSPLNPSPFTSHSALKSSGLSPYFSFGDSISSSAREAFLEFAAGPYEVDDFRVLRGEPDDFVVFARRNGDVWKIGALSVNAGSLTVRFEDLWQVTPESARHLTYRVEVLHDAQTGRNLGSVCFEGDSVCREAAVATKEILEDVAPDARIFLDHSAAGGFLLTFTPVQEN